MVTQLSSISYEGYLVYYSILIIPILQSGYCSLTCIWESALGGKACLVLFFISFRSSLSEFQPLRNHLPPCLVHVICVRQTPSLGSRAPLLIHQSPVISLALCLVQRDILRLHYEDPGLRMLLNNREEGFLFPLQLLKLAEYKGSVANSPLTKGEPT